MLREIRIQEIPKIPPSLLELPFLKAETTPLKWSRTDLAAHFPHLSAPFQIQFKKESQRNSKPLTLGVVFSGGPAAGGHNVICGLFDALKMINDESNLIGFLGGPSGILDGKYRFLDEKAVAAYRNLGGFDLLGTGRTKIEKEEQFAKCLEIAKNLHLDGLVIVGGDDSNTNAAHLADYFLKMGSQTSVVGVPKTIDGDLKNVWIETSFGFDSAARTYSEIIGNIASDALSQKKYYFFIKVMGRTASHLVLECALKTHPNLALISEEIIAEKASFGDVIEDLVDLIVKRSTLGKDYGVILIPEGLAELIPGVFEALPEEMKTKLLADKDPHGNIQVSKIETERLLIDLVTKSLAKRKDYQGKFSPQPLFVGYEGRSCFPSPFDSAYCYSLGMTAALMVANHLTAVMATIKHLDLPISNWVPCGVSLIPMMELVERNGKQIPVIEKGLVDLKEKPFQEFQKNRIRFRTEDDYQSPGPIQFFGPEARSLS